MNHHFSEIPMSSMKHQYRAHTQEPKYPQQQLARIPVSAPTGFDVINGRGIGVHRHPGNDKYRTLVLLNKGIYAKCPKSDKSKISKGIVAAIRELGGGFLELDERSGTYHDIGDKKACAKTSQALREGQTKIRQKIYGEMADKSNYDTSLIISLSHDSSRAVPAEGYFTYSVQLLESLYSSDQSMLPQPASIYQHVSPSPPLGFKDSDEAKPATKLSLHLEESPKGLAG